MALLSHIWQGLQAKLFPFLDEVLTPLTKKQQELVGVLELARIEEFVQGSVCWRGRPPKNRQAIARAFIAKSVYNLTTTRQLLDHLRSNPNLRRLCGWESVSDIPSESVFSRVFAFFAETGVVQKVHARLIEEYESNRLVGHISRDSTAIEARERVKKKPPKRKVKRRHKRGRPKKGESVPAKEPSRLECQQTMTIGFGGRYIRVKGHTKVMAHLMFGIVALCADQLLKLLS